MKNFKKLRKKLIELGLKYQETKEKKYLKYLALVVKPTTTQMYTVIYNFLLKAGMLNLLKDFHYSTNQHQIKELLILENSKDYYIIKEFLISIMDARITFAHPNLIEKTFTKEFIENIDTVHILEILNKAKSDKDLRDFNFSFESHSKTMENVINFYNTLQENPSSSIDSKISAISKALNVMHHTGYCFFYCKETNNFLPIFDEFQSKSLSNISVLVAERELKKLLF